ncbi:GNAT family N-acetyltransferase [Butyricicoccus sp.]|uniref:GNAT family N-acetyltransferase n=1 Tax=Butyricicoccus sp. TaxID=2049021 RepID=UPI003734E96D
MNTVEFRYATENDVDKILFFIKGIAEYEKMSDEVVTTEALLREWVFEKKSAEVIFAMEDGKEVGFALFFHNFSTFVGRAGIYLEDIFVLPEHRKKGYGKALFTQVAKIAADQGCGRMEWCCLDWNQPSIDFYRSFGAIPMNGWTTYRLAGDTLKAAAAQAQD